MIKTLGKALILSLFASALAVVPALAATPSLSAYYQGSNVQITVSNANANAQIDLYFQTQGSSLFNSISNIGRTDYSGYFTQSISLGSSAYNVSQMYVIVGGLQSPTVTVSSGSCTYNCGSPTGLSLSQNNLNLNSGQSSTVNILNNGAYNTYNNFYISSNSNSNVASASISGSSLYVYGNQNGSTTISVCQSGGNAGCASLYVTVGSSGGCTYPSTSSGPYGNCGTGNLTLSQSNVNVNIGQTSYVGIFYSGNSYNNFYISNNGNSSVASASISGNQLLIVGVNAGSTTINVCASNSGSACATVYVTVGGCNYGNCTGSLSLSQTNLSLNSGQSSSVTANNYNGGSLYISSNSNPNAVSVSISGSTINFYGINNGSSSVSVCASNTSQCATVYVTVGGGGSGSGLTFSQSSVTLSLNQNTNISITGTGGYYISSNSNPGVVSASIAGSTVYLNALSSGSSTISVCQALGSVQCGSIYVTVTGGGSSGSSIWFSQNSVNLTNGQNMSVTIYSNNYGGNYYVSSNSNSGVVSANVVGNSLNLIGQGTGSATVTVCQSNGSGCGSVYVTANGGSCGYYGCGNNGANISLSQTSLSLNLNQSATVNIYGGGNYYISSNSNSAVASATLNGSVLNVYAGSFGSSTISVCQNSGSGCVSVYVTVAGGSVLYPGTSNVLGASTYLSGQLINENGTVYIVYKNTKTGFTSASVFTGLGFKFSNVLNVGTSGLLDSGYTVRTQAAAHPWGSWVKSGTTVYFVHEAGLVPVPDWNTFLNNGGQANLIVNANIYDLRLPMLSVMVSGDFRLR